MNQVKHQEGKQRRKRKEQINRCLMRNAYVAYFTCVHIVHCLLIIVLDSTVRKKMMPSLEKHWQKDKICCICLTEESSLSGCFAHFFLFSLECSSKAVCGCVRERERDAHRTDVANDCIVSDLAGCVKN